jgi:hypothetical protein
MRRTSTEILSRIVHFEKSTDTTVSSSPRVLEFDESLDYDSCISPVAARSKSIRSIRLPSFVLDDITREPSWSVVNGTSSEGEPDYDSCLSPMSTPKWTIHEYNEFLEDPKSHTFDHCHSLLNDHIISHFLVTPDPSGLSEKILSIQPTIPPRSVIISGSFNPLHHGHEALARRAVESTPNSSGEFFFEISTINVDKGVITADEMERRVDFIISRGFSVLLTNLILFDEKSQKFPNTIFAIGYDTYTRVINPKYYPLSNGGLQATMSRIEANGCEFYVGGRVDSTGNYSTLGMVRSASEAAASPIFSPIHGFRHDISSTEIRRSMSLNF